MQNMRVQPSLSPIYILVTVGNGINIIIVVVCYVLYCNCYLSKENSLYDRNLLQRINKTTNGCSC